MNTTVTDLDGFGRLRLAALSSLTADKVTPEHVLTWDMGLRDRAVMALAEDLARFQGVPSPLERYMAAAGCAAVLSASTP